MHQIIDTYAYNQTMIYNQRIFLASSVHVPARYDWQSSVISFLKNHVFTDSYCTIVHLQHGTMADTEKIKLYYQYQAKSTYTVIYFDQQADSSIYMLELGMYLHSKQVIVICHKDFIARLTLEQMCVWWGIHLMIHDPDTCTLDTELLQNQHFFKDTSKWKVI